MTERIKNCPKCNSGDVDFFRDRDGMWHLKCFTCGFTRVACLSMRQVIDTWNKAYRHEEANLWRLIHD